MQNVVPTRSRVDYIKGAAYVIVYRFNSPVRSAVS